jgi:hypothetical protein
MNRSALVRLVVSLLLCTSAQAQNAFQIIELRPQAAQEKRLAVSIRFDNATEASQRVQALDGVPSVILLGASRPVRERQYIPTPAGVIPQEVTVVQQSTAAIEVIPRVAGERVEVEISKRKVNGRLGEWFEVGQVAMSAGGETRRLWIKVDEVP